MKDYRRVSTLCTAYTLEQQPDCTLFKDRGSVQHPPYNDEVSEQEYLLCAYKGKRGECFYIEEADKVIESIPLSPPPALDLKSAKGRSMLPY